MNCKQNINPVYFIFYLSNNQGKNISGVYKYGTEIDQGGPGSFITIQNLRYSSQN